MRSRRIQKISRAVAALLLAPIALVCVLAVVTPLPPELREPPAPSLRIHSRDGKLLREVRADDGARARPLPLDAFPAHVQRAVLAAEDRRFYSHPGIDVLAVGRAAISNAVHLRVVSGASTITMQLARTVRPHRRSLWGKVTEAALALRIESSLSKERILEEYLNRVVYGPNVRGYAAASHAYFGVAPDALSVAQAALLAGLPRGPSLYDVTKRPALAKRRRDRVLERMADAELLDQDAKARALAEPLVVTLEKPAYGAPHFVRGLVDRSLARLQPDLERELAVPGAIMFETTIDPDLQRTAEAAVTTTLADLRDKHVTAAAVVVLENATGDVLAWVGSAGFFDVPSLGQNDGVVALRQPGSALKPFVYAEAMERLGYTGATVLPDVELHIPLPGGGDYVPHDYDTKQRGPVRLREALGNSLNIPAVHTLHRLGTQAVLDRLHAVGFASLKEPAEHYGPALALGDGEVTLVELANAYATLARGGALRPVRLVRFVERRGESVAFDVAPAKEVMAARTAALLTDILRDKHARTASFGDQNVLELEVDVAAKTGTSKGYRDNVAVGFTRAVTVAVWTGNFDGSPMAAVSGIAGAGPIWNAVMTAASRRGGPRQSLALDADAERHALVRTSVCALSGDLPTAACPHRVTEWLPESDAAHGPHCTTHEAVRVDVRNGLRAGPGCPAETTTTRVFERWRAPFAEWASRTSRPTVPAESSPSCPVEDAPGAPAGDLRITYPFDGSRFVIDPERPPELQVVDVRVAPDEPGVELRVDGALLDKTRSWALAPGAHTITARAASGREAPPVHFVVR